MSTDFIKAQMGINLATDSHFTVVNRSSFQCQVTVIMTGFCPGEPFHLPLPSRLTCYSKIFRLSLRIPEGILPGRSVFFRLIS